MANEGRQLRLIIQTPRGEIFASQVAAVRFPTQTGDVGLHAGHEPLLLAVEPGLVLARADGKTHFIGTPGGILQSDGQLVRLLTPTAVLGESSTQASAAVKEMQAAPDAEMQARARLNRLESSIVAQLRRPSRPRPSLK